MTEVERAIITEAIVHAQEELTLLFEDWISPCPPTLIELYDRAKPVHTAALGIWCAVVQVLRDRKGLDNSPNRSLEDAINLEELFPTETADARHGNT